MSHEPVANRENHFLWPPLYGNVTRHRYSHSNAPQCQPVPSCAHDATLLGGATRTLLQEAI